MSIDLSTCQVGQKVYLRNGAIVPYEVYDEVDDSYPHQLDGRWYTNEGCYCHDQSRSDYDVVRILPLEPAKSNQHPSVAAWKSFPWITDRLPTQADGDSSGHVLTLTNYHRLLIVGMTSVATDQPWVHLPTWAPPKLTPQEEALALMEGKKDGWVPTPDDWHVIRRAICS
jgi:hypothetical protein